MNGLETAKDSRITMKEKFFLAGACLAGVFAVAYGMARKNDIVFVIGILIVIETYLAIGVGHNTVHFEKVAGRVRTIRIYSGWQWVTGRKNGFKSLRFCVPANRFGEKITPK